LSIIPNGWLRVLNPSVESRLGSVRHALFDFDGTLSVLRQGWEPVMESVMLDAISPGKPPSPEMISEVRSFIDRSTGILTIHQMGWLVEAVQRFNLTQDVRTAKEYKQVYLKALMVSVSKRLERLESGQAIPDEYLIAGSAEFLRGLAERGVELYVASGSDHPDVVREARALGIAEYFTGGIFGALDSSEANGKDRIIQRILNEHGLAGKELLVVGDGPVEIVEAQARGAISLGVASDEIIHCGWNRHKIERLARAGADLLVADFLQADSLVKKFVSVPSDQEDLQ
jgi:phosphoglycolate phosphatase-like HAD superfamily hydrolase